MAHLRPRARSGDRGAGELRRELYDAAKRRMNRAMGAGFWLEAVALQESMIADRLESLIARSSGDHQLGRNAGGAARKLLNSDIDEEIRNLAGEVLEWNRQRNGALHELVKVDEHDARPWVSRLGQAREAAREGALLLGWVNALVERKTRRRGRQQ